MTQEPTAAGPMRVEHSPLANPSYREQIAQLWSDLRKAEARIAELEAAIRSFLLVGCVQEAENGPCAVSSGTQSLRAALAGRETG